MNNEQPLTEDEQHNVRENDYFFQVTVSTLTKRASMIVGFLLYICSDYYTLNFFISASSFFLAIFRD